MGWNSLLTAISFGFGLAGLVQGQSKTFTDSKTGIEFQSVSQGDYTFGIALPTKIFPSSDFIGRISAKGKGWAGVSLGGRMANSLMVVVWPDGDKVIASLRSSNGYVSPEPSTNSSISLEFLSAGTMVEGDSYTYTFVCKKCLQNDDSTFKVDADSASIGYALATAPVAKPADPGSKLSFHNAGQALFKYDLAAARKEKFAGWADNAEKDENAAKVNGGVAASSSSIVVTTSNSTYDYIVVGSGPAGLITAQRLTETGGSVLLLERGGPSIAPLGGKRIVPWNSSVTYYDVPGEYMNMLGATEGEGFCSDTAGLAGCISGGGGTMNAMAWFWPTSWDFDDKWPAGWKSKDMAAAVERTKQRNPATQTPSADGKWYDTQSWTVLEEWYKSNGWNLADNIKTTDDKIKSYARPALNIAQGVRSGPLRTYLPLAQTKSNFKYQMKSKVMRVIREGPKMTGVEVETGPDKREIIKLNPGGKVALAAGAYSTPRLLFNSGIGRPKEIKIAKSSKQQITLPDEKDWINLPVGEGMKDHSRYQIWFNVTDGFKTMTNSQLLKPEAAAVDLYSKGSGVLTQSFMRMDTFRQVTTKDGHKIFFQSHAAAPEDGRIEFTYLQTHGITSEGTLSINQKGNTYFTKEPWANTDTDKEAWTLALDELLEMARKPGSRVVYADGKQATAADILKTPVQQGVHVTGGALMGTDDGRKGGKAVVDLDTKVYGTDNLFVTDASFHPDLPTGNTQGIIAVAAEQAVKRMIAVK